MSKISLNASMRTNLLSLQNISRQVSDTQQRLSTGNKVNSAIDNPSSYYTARSLTNRADDLSALLDSMGQAVQTIKAANEGIEAGLDLLEQLQAVGNQALENPSSASGAGSDMPPELVTKDLNEYISAGYTAITADMNTNEIKALLTEGAKLVLAEDIVLSSALNLTKNNITIDGNGHKLIYDDTNYRQENMIYATGNNIVITNIELDCTAKSSDWIAGIWLEEGSADISSIKITVHGDFSYGILCGVGGKVTLDSTGGIEVIGTNSQKITGAKVDLYDGKSNTQEIVAQLSEKALAAYAATQFYVGDKDGEFGQGNWYLPSIGELMDVYGTDMSQVSDSFSGTSGAIGNNKAAINASLSKLKAAGAEAETLTNSNYWSSSESESDGIWAVNMSNDNRKNGLRTGSCKIRCFQVIENCFSGSNGPQIGNVMYTDKTYGSADDYDGSKTAVGIVTAVGDDGSVKIMNLKDLTFSSTSTVNNFDADNPYGGRSQNTSWVTSDEKYTNVAAAPDFPGGYITITGTGTSSSGSSVNSAYAAQYNEILNQYDMLIGDSSYKGINLLKADTLDVNFNEYRTTGYSIAGKDISSKNIGLQKANWTSFDDVEVSIEQVRSAILTLRSYSGELGNGYSIVQNRQEFTQNLINILTEGADKLTLADMNEESANMLALQTRQQLAINSLSLASQASQAILKLF